MLGSSAFASLLALYTPLCGALYVALAYAAGGVTGDGGWAAQSAVGFSGVLFALAVDESALTPAPMRSVFGLFSVPTRLYPWVLMLVLQLLLPNISFLGHLAGILAGSLHAAGGLAWALPSLPALRRLEAAHACAPCARARAASALPSPALSHATAMPSASPPGPLLAPPSSR